MGARLETDFLGPRDIPARAYYGINTLRAAENFMVSGKSIGDHFELIRMLAAIKKAAAFANHRLELIDRPRMLAIAAAADEVMGGALQDQFIVDVIQGGAGTSTNMNVNEVIANRALEIMGFEKGDYESLHPNEHVNLSQSTNDVYPTALRLAAYVGVTKLTDAMCLLEQAFERKAVEFDDVLKIGRTQLQDAVPMTLGQEFLTYAVMLGEDRLRLGEAAQLMTEINLGATAIGTGINTHPDYAEVVREELQSITGLAVTTAANLIEATQDCGAFVQLSGVLKRTAVKLSKVCNDLRLLSSGPRAGFGEINLPPLQAGSSIMPGKVNPVIPELVNQVAFEVIGNDLTVTFAAEAGQLQLNAFEPIIAYSLFQSIDHLTKACLALAEKCVNGISANRDRLKLLVENSASVVTALNPHIGYAKASELLKEALLTGSSISDLVLSHNLLSSEHLKSILAPQALTKPNGLGSGLVDLRGKI